MNTAKLLLCALCLFFSTTTIAETIHWELSTPQFDGYTKLTGGFNYNSDGSISNVTLRTDTLVPPQGECFLCEDATGYDGTAFGTGASFYREFFRNGEYAGHFLFGFSDLEFDIGEPGSYSDLDFQIQRHVIHFDDPWNPDTLEQSGCSSCLTAIGTIVTTPIPEPETYGMLIAGLGILGWWGRHKKTDHPLHQAA